MSRSSTLSSGSLAYGFIRKSQATTPTDTEMISASIRLERSRLGSRSRTRVSRPAARSG
jgi:hypothetical protein